MEEELSIISLQSALITISEDGGTLLIPVERTGNISNEVSFDYSITDGFAVADEDFIASSGTLTFASQETIKEIAVPIIDDTFAEIDETFNVQIGEPSVGGELGIIRTALVTIADNDPPGDNTISFSAATYSVSEDAGAVTITVVRSGSAEQPATVEYSTQDGYARAGQDYIEKQSEVLTFAAGETSKTFTIAVLEDDLLELDESFKLTLASPAGAALGAQSTAKLTIAEDDTSPFTFEERLVVSGLATGEATSFSPPGPTAFDWTPDGRMYIAKLDGVVLVYENDQLLVEPFLDISAQVNTGGQRGLLGLAVDPNFPTSPYIYLAYSYDPPGVAPDLSDVERVTRLVRVEADPATNYTTALPDSEVILLETPPVFNFHAAGAIEFGTDGALYFSHGDGQAVGTSSGVEKAELLSRLDNPYGKLLRIDPMTGAGLPDNPFYIAGQPDHIQSKIYNYGLRNPWRYTLHPKTNEPFMGDVGQATWEEINRGTGEFFGWSLYEGGNGENLPTSTSSAFQSLYESFEETAVAPIYAENHAYGARAIVVGDFYTGTAFPELYQGSLIFTDFGTGALRALVFDEQGQLNSAVPLTQFSDSRGVSYMAMGPDGEFYYANILQGEIGILDFVDTTDDGSPGGETGSSGVLYRVNAGGPEIAAGDEGPHWSADTFVAPNAFLTSTGSNAVASWPAVEPHSGVPSTVPAAIFDTERFDVLAAPNMQWAFAVPEAGAYRVNLYLGNGFGGTDSPGDRVFDVAVEGTVPTAFDDIDLAKTFGHLTGGVLSTTVEVTDGTLNLEFLHSVENPLINGIEILRDDGTVPPVSPSPTVSLIELSANPSESDGAIQLTLASDIAVPIDETVVVTFEIAPGSATAEVDYRYESATAIYDAQTGVYTDTVAIAGGTSTASLLVELLADNFEEANETFSINLISVTDNAQLGTDSVTIAIVDDDAATPSATVLYRVNAGGTVVEAADGGPDWSADTGAAPSLYLQAGSNTTNGFAAIEPGPTVSSSIPGAIYDTERWEAAGGAEMQWAFNVPESGLYRVNLYLGNGFGGTNDPGERIFDVAVEGIVPAVFNDIDLSQQFGHLVGGVLSATVEVTDGTLNLEFLHGVENPLVNGIEILQVGEIAPPPTMPQVSLVGGPYNPSESDGTVQLTIASDVAIPTNETVTVTFEVVPGTAVAAVDYSYSSPTATYNPQTGIYTDTVAIAGGASSTPITVDVLADELIEGNETFNVKLVGISANAQIGTDSAIVTVADDDVDDPIAPAIATSNTVSVPENQTAVLDVQATDANGDTEGNGLSYSFGGGSDDALFALNSDTGVLAFSAAPDFENPTDSDGNNVYEVAVIVTDTDGLTDTQLIAVTVTDVDENTDNSPITIQAEDITTVTGYRLENDSDADNGAMLSLVGGAGGEVGTASFTFSGPTGQYRIVLGTFDENDGAATLEVTKNGGEVLGTVVLNQNPGGNAASPDTKVALIIAANEYLATGDIITVKGIENASEHARFDFIRFEPLSNDSPQEPLVAPAIATSDTVTVAENQTAVIDVQATDANGDSEGSGLSYRLSGGADEALFTINSDTGVLAFIAAPNFEAPADEDANNVYEVGITVTDSDGLIANQLIAVTVADVDEPKGGTPITLQAEDIELVAGYRLENDIDAENGAMLSLVGGASAEVGTASFAFNGPTGRYRLVLGTFDENDGAATFEISRNNGELIGSVLLDQNPGGNAASPNTKVERIIAADVALTAGEVITVQGNENASEHARFDFIRFEPLETVPHSPSDEEPDPDSPSVSSFNYAEALQKSFLFYEAQRSGPLPNDNRIEWRGDSALDDGSDVGVDLSGGYYDAGDHVKFGFPMAFSMTMLSWGIDEYRQAYSSIGQLDEALQAIKWGTDYLLKAHVADENGTIAFWGQVGDGNTDHDYWGTPEAMTMARPAFKIDQNNPGSDLAAEVAAALAAASLAFRPTNAAYADELLVHAEQLYAFADTYRGKYSDAIPNVQSFYNSWSGYYDELAWGAAWLYEATGDASYLQQAEAIYQAEFSTLGPAWTLNWDDKSYGAAVLLAQQTGAEIYKEAVESWLDAWVNGTDGVQITSGGLRWVDQWGALRYAANTAFIAGVYADTVDDPTGGYSALAETTMDYLLGDNPRNASYVVGFGNNFPLQPHHRAAHGGTWDTYESSEPNTHVLFGALVGGPEAADDFAYEDSRTNYVANEVALNYNAGYTGAIARMVERYGGEPLSDAALDALPGIVVTDVG